MEGCLVLFFFFFPERQLIYERGLSQLVQLTHCSFMREYKIQSVFKNLSWVPHPPVLPVLRTFARPSFPREVCLQAHRWTGTCSPWLWLRLAWLHSPFYADVVVLFLVLFPALLSLQLFVFFIWFSFSPFMLPNTYSWLLERVKMLCYRFSGTCFFCQRSQPFDSMGQITKKEKWDMREINVLNWG